LEAHRLKILVGNAFNELKAAYEADHEGLHFDVIVQAWLHCRYISGLDNRYGKLIETLEELETQLERAQGQDFLPKWLARKMNMHDLINSGTIQGSKNIERAAKFMKLIELKLKPDHVNKALNGAASKDINDSKNQRGPNMQTLPKEIWQEIEKDFDVSKKNFGKKINFVKDKYKRNVIFRDVEHSYLLACNGFSKPAVILAGGVIEELLRLYLDSKGVRIKSDSFNDYIKACESNGLLKLAIHKLSDSVRHFRNIVHLSKETSSKITISKATAKGAVSSIFTIANDF
jgi:hypothetical protein